MSDQQNSGVVVAVGKRRTVRFLNVVRRLNPKNLSPKGRKVLIGVIVLCIIAASAGAGFLYVKDQRSATNQCNGNEDSQIYKRAGQVMNPLANNELGEVVDDMQNMKRFKSDPTCLYVATVYNLEAGKIESSRKHYELLKGLGSKKDVIQIGPEQIKSLDQLNFEITKEEQRSSIEYENMKRFSEGPNE